MKRRKRSVERKRWRKKLKKWNRENDWRQDKKWRKREGYGKVKTRLRREKELTEIQRTSLETKRCGEKARMWREKKIKKGEGAGEGRRS